MYIKVFVLNTQCKILDVSLEINQLHFVNVTINTVR